VIDEALASMIARLRVAVLVVSIGQKGEGFNGEGISGRKRRDGVMNAAGSAEWIIGRES
jgi:hypothetical protein